VKRTIVFILLIIAINANAQKIKFSRVCNGGNNNLLSWQITQDTCTLIEPLSLFAKDIITSPYIFLAGNILSTSGSYVHINANVPSTKEWKYYISYKTKCGVDTIQINTDSLGVDNEKPDSTILDSVSVDPINNTVLLGWTSNRTPDFSSYYLYNYDRTDPRLIENYKDTFFTDLTPIDPRTKSLTYDITSSDSCDNRKEYGNYKHQTIHLTVIIDTCSNTANLNWTQYVGWQTEKHEIYRNINNTGFVKINSVLGSEFSYLDKNLPKNSTLQYFIRAYKTPIGNKATSSSNSNIPINSGKSQNPFNTKILQVTNNSNNNLEITIVKNPLSNYSSIDIYREEPNGVTSLIYTLSASEDKYADMSANNQNTYKYYVVSKNVCGDIADTSEISNNIVLKTFETDIDYLLRWGRYFTWNKGVKEYVIYRATGDNISNATNFLALASSTLDTNFLDLKTINSTTCYYVTAKEDGGQGLSKSNTSCLNKKGEIYYPNAIVIGGVNQNFTFIGYSIDLSKTTIYIYNRWGQQEYGTTNFEKGWDGRNQSGNFVSPGVYFFTAEVDQGLEKQKINGNITVLE
jgi:hypothetical protein